MACESGVALLTTRWTMLPHEEKSALDIFKRLTEIDYALRDYFISWEQTKRLLQERTELIDLLKKLGYEP